jgi:hypothetical protein
MPALFTLTTFGKLTTIRLTSDTAKSVGADLDQGTDVAVAHHCQAPILPEQCRFEINHKHDTCPICDVNAGHVFHFAGAQSPKRRNVPGK